MSLLYFLNPRDVVSADWLVRNLPDEPAWEDRVVKVDFFEVQFAIELEAMKSALESDVPWHLTLDLKPALVADDPPQTSSTSLSPPPRSPRSQSSSPPSPKCAPGPQVEASPAPSSRLPTPSSDDSDSGRFYKHKHSDAEIKALISGWAMPAETKFWSQSANEALIYEMISAICGPNLQKRTHTDLFKHLAQRLRGIHGVAKDWTAVRTHWQRNMRAVCGVDERRKPKPHRLGTSLLEKQKREREVVGVKKVAEKVGKVAGLKSLTAVKEKKVVASEGKKRKRAEVESGDEDEDAKLARKLQRDELGLRKR